MNEMMLSLFIAIAFYTDIRYYRIPNLLTVIAAVSGMIYFAYTDGWEGLAHSIGAMCAMFAMSFILYLIRAIGAGDVKLFAAIGALIGVKSGFWLFIYALLFSGIIAMIISIIQKKLMMRIYFGFRTFFGLLFQRNKKSYINTIYASPRFPMMWAVLPAFITVIYESYFYGG